MSGVLGTVRRLLPAGPALLGTGLPSSGVTGEAVALVDRFVRSALGPPAAVLARAAISLEGAPARRTWSAEGRAHIELREVDGDRPRDVVAALDEELPAVDGVRSVRVDGPTRRAVVRFDPARARLQDVVDAVDRAESRVPPQSGSRGPRHAGSFPGDQQPVSREAWALVADLAGLSAAVAGRLARLPALPGSVAAAAVFVDNQPRLRSVLERGLGIGTTDLVLATANAVSLALTQGTSSLVVDAAQRAQAFSAGRARREAFDRAEASLWADDRPGALLPPGPRERPTPVPSGPVERYADRVAAGSLLAAGGLLLARRSLDLAGRAILVGAPKAARAGREAFADTLAKGLCDRGTLVMNPQALRLVDRVDTLVLDSAVLHEQRPLVVAASALAEHWNVEHVWSAAQRLLWQREELPVPPPPGRRRHRLSLQPPEDDGSGLARRVLTEDGVPVGEVRVGTELHPLSDAVLAAAQEAGLRLLVTSDSSAVELGGRADEVLDRSVDLAARIRRLQSDGHVVVVLSTDEAALAAADVGVGVVPATGRVPWAADLLLPSGLAAVPLVLHAVPRARTVSGRGVTLAAGGAFLGLLLGVVGGPAGRSRATVPVTVAAAVALIDGTVTARRVLRLPDPAPVWRAPWHVLQPDEVLARLPRPALGPPERAGSGGAPGPVRRLAALGRSVAAELADPLTPVLTTGAAASAVIGSPTDALLVGGVLLGNAAVSGVQRLRAERALGRLLTGEQPTARRLPGNAAQVSIDGSSDIGCAEEVPAGDLRVGDVVELHPGDVVPADCRLLAVDGLEVDEAILTGESVAIDKQVRATPGAELPDRACMVYEGTTVLAGAGRALVVATGAATEGGRAVALAAGAGAPTGMQGRLEELTRRGLPVTLLGGLGVTGLAMLRGRPVRQAVASGVSVAVAAVPEGLPLVATVSQLGAARRLSSRGVLVRSTRTVEALGRVDTVCFDKTGTLTEGRLRVVRLAGPDCRREPGTAEGRRVLRAAARACPRPEGGHPVTHATDQAILDAADALFETDEDWEELRELPFQSERGFSAALGRTPRRLRLVVKGAPEVLLPRCTNVRDGQGDRRMDAAARKRAEGIVLELAADGLRVLAVARRTLEDDGEPVAADQVPDPDDLTEDLTLLGFVALADAPRPQARRTVADLAAAGISPVMITGDHPVTARAVAADLGIPAQRVVTGAEFAALDEAGRIAVVTGAGVFARVSPEQKLRIVAALQRAGRVVAMTGDGANDAAAIRLADVGIGMAAHGSTSARSAADLVLTRPDISLLLDALVEGRAMWGRVRDAVAILLGGNAGEVGFTLVGTALAGRAPIGTRQFLLVNMLTDLLPSMAISLAPTPQQPPQRQRLLCGGVPSLGAPLYRDIAVRGVATASGALAAWQIGRLTGRPRRASTMALAALVGTQLGQTLLAGGRDPLVVGTALGSGAVLAAVIQLPGVSQFFGCTPLGPFAWAVVVGCAAVTTGGAYLADRYLPAPAVEPLLTDPAPVASCSDSLTPPAPEELP